ncbi:16S rRNA (guanine(966)-N(2))-methyltransferase RsmD [Teredinibacter turnerae]|uniref:16S rRNA (guanine(966)-N(2))-methyltransferase RsmD n=1 Tax=Teredinibacter turnerae TaxID=2426 RepID=UPI0003763CD5|nr:16S rRNA (guanine(966)-N(2))-methyltransferase RsmD [Teredinibacter turnerae]
MKILEGAYKGRRLFSPLKSKTRPISGVAKQRVFNLIRGHIDNSDVLDLFAGTGSVGIEALSRGCKNVTFIESNYSAISVIKKNVKDLEAEERIKIIQFDVFKYVKVTDEKFDLIFSMPPYQKKYFDRFLEVIDSHPDILRENGVIVFETSLRFQKEAFCKNFIVIDELIKGESLFQIWKRKE